MKWSAWTCDCPLHWLGTSKSALYKRWNSGGIIILRWLPSFDSSMFGLFHLITKFTGWTIDSLWQGTSYSNNRYHGYKLLLLDGVLTLTNNVLSYNVSVCCLTKRWYPHWIYGYVMYTWPVNMYYWQGCTYTMSTPHPSLNK